MTPNVAELINSALALMDDPDIEDVDISGLSLDEAKAKLEAAYEERWIARLEAYLAGRDNKLMALRYVRAAAIKRRDMFQGEVARLAAVVARDAKTIAFVEACAKRLLDAERATRGDPEKSYAAKLPDGSALTLRVSKTQAVCVEVGAVEKLPPEFVRVKVETEPKKVEIKKALEDGRELYGCSIVTNTHERVEGWTR